MDQISRRTVIKGAAAAGGLAWAAPTIIAASGSAANAVSGGCSGCTGTGSGLILGGSPVQSGTTTTPGTPPTNANCLIPVGNPGGLVCGGFDSTTCTAGASATNIILQGPCNTTGIGPQLASCTMVGAVTTTAQQAPCAPGQPCTSQGSTNIVGLVLGGTPIATTGNICGNPPINVGNNAVLGANLGAQTCNADGSFTVTGIQLFVGGTLVAEVAKSTVAGCNCTCTPCHVCPA